MKIRIKTRNIVFFLMLLISIIGIAVLLITLDIRQVQQIVQSYLESRYDTPYEIVFREKCYTGGYDFDVKDSKGDRVGVFYDKKKGIKDEIFKQKIETKILKELNAYMNEMKTNPYSSSIYGIGILNQEDANLYNDYRIEPPSYEVFIERVLIKNPSATITLIIDGLVMEAPTNNITEIYQVLKFIENKEYFYTDIYGTFYIKNQYYYFKPLSREKVRKILKDNNLDVIKDNFVVYGRFKDYKEAVIDPMNERAQSQ